MKKCLLISNSPLGELAFCPKAKRIGFESFMPTMLSPLTMFMQSQENSYNRQQQERMFNKNWENQRIENIAARGFADLQARLARDWQERMANEFFSRTNEYNTPANQVQRLVAAGVNPAAVFGQGATGVAASSSMPSATPATAGHSAIPSNVAPSIYSSETMSSTIKNIADAFGSIASARKQGAETSQIEAELTKRLRALDLSNEAQEVANNIKKKYGEKEAEKFVEKLEASVREIDQHVKTLKSEEKLNGAKELTEAYIETLYSAKSQNESVDKELKEILKGYYSDLLDSEIKRNRAEANQANNAANLYGAKARQELVLADMSETEWNNIKANKDAFNSYIHTAVQSVINKATISDADKQDAERMLYNAEHANSWRTALMYYNGIQSVLGDAADVAGVVMGAKAGLMNAGANVTRANTAAKRVNSVQETHVTKYHDQRGNPHTSTATRYRDAHD